MLLVINIFVVHLLICINSQNTENPMLYYYGLEESERALPKCGNGQACSALMHRYWIADALLRLCRCGRRTRCDEPTKDDRTVEINNRAVLQFCQPVMSNPICSTGESPLSVESNYNSMNPDDLEQFHHKNIPLVPPKIELSCRCRVPNYWKLNTALSTEERQIYECSFLPLCESGEVCGNVREDLMALHQSCLCPKSDICLHDGGVPKVEISELLYRGKGWKAHCQKYYEGNYEDY